MKKITKENFETLFKQAAKSAHDGGNLSITDWAEMCTEMERQNIGTMPNEGQPFTDPRHLAFIAGAKWGVERANGVTGR
jgi:hypothetical protein